MNGAIGYARDHHWNIAASSIIEGADEWTVRPVAEVLAESEADGAHARSALIGLIWRAQDNLAFDVGVRYGRTDEVGPTWSFAVAK